METDNNQPPAINEVQTASALSLIMNGAAFDRVMIIAEMMSNGSVMVPKHFRGNKADCMAVTMQALRWGADPFAVAGKTHIVNGNLGYEAQLVNAVLRSTGAVISRPHYEYKGEGENLECRVGFIIAGETEITWNQFLILSKVKTRNSPLWVTNPDQQLGYLQVKNFARLYCPGAILGIYTADELETIPPEPRDITPNNTAAPEEKPIVYYPDEAFNKNFPKWKAAVETGKSTTETWINTLSAKNPLTEAQIARINEVKAPIEGEVEQNANT